LDDTHATGIRAHYARFRNITHALSCVAIVHVSTVRGRAAVGFHLTLSLAAHRYLDDVAAGKLPVNNQIIYLMQDIFNLLPDLNGMYMYAARAGLADWLAHGTVT
jgi:26S proteasome regulatory subunit N8